MKFGRREFSLVDLIGDALVTTWQGRQAVDWTVITRRLIKLAGLALVAITLMYVLYPTQKRSWLLWLGEEERVLAHWTAVSIVGFTALILSLGRYAWEHHKALGVAGTIAAVVTIGTAIMGQWNYYSYASGRAVNVSESATGGAVSRIQEAERRLAQLDAEIETRERTFAADIARTPANYVTARSRVMAQQNAARSQSQQERATLQAELRAARAANTDVQLTVADPRPIDRFIAGCWKPGPCVARSAAATALDLQRSALFEFICLIGVSLCTTYAFGQASQPHVVYERAASPWAAIEDWRKRPKVRPSPWGLQARAFDRETGEEVFHAGPVKRGERTEMGTLAEIETPPIVLPDESGVQFDADSRVARTLHEEERQAIDESSQSVPLGAHEDSVKSAQQSDQHEPRALKTQTNRDANCENDQEREQQFELHGTSLFGEPGEQADGGGASDSMLADEERRNEPDSSEQHYFVPVESDLTEEELLALAGASEQPEQKVDERVSKLESDTGEQAEDNRMPELPAGRE